MKTKHLLWLIGLIWTHAYSQPTRPEREIQTFHQAHQLLTEVIVADIFTPPAASRIYAYAHIAAYETLVALQGEGYRSLAGQIRDFPPLSVTATTNSNAGLAATEALLVVGRTLVFSENSFDEAATRLWSQVRQQGYSDRTVQASRAVGQQVARHVLVWAAGDHYKQTRSLRRYSPLKQAGAWLPTPPGYLAASEPYWMRIRPLTLDSASQCRVAGPIPFSTDRSSLFYNAVREVYEVGTHLTPEERLIANYWDCNPFFISTQGHLNFASKKLSPGGHWMSIAGQVSRQTKASLMKTSTAYLLTALAVFDAFISCWDEKYRHNTIRPETYINAHLDESWRPILQTPPFPEYPSGHSVVSTSAAVVLTHLFGPNLALTDSTEIPYGLPFRRFSSLGQAAVEASLSRLYGGIHLRQSLVDGQAMGQKVGEQVLASVKLRVTGGTKPPVLKASKKVTRATGSL